MLMKFAVQRWMLENYIQAATDGCKARTGLGAMLMKKCAYMLDTRNYVRASDGNKTSSKNCRRWGDLNENCAFQEQTQQRNKRTNKRMQAVMNRVKTKLN